MVCSTGRRGRSWPSSSGTWCGLGWYRRRSDAQFAKIMNLLLIAAGFGQIL